MPVPLWLHAVPVLVVGAVVAWQCRPISRRHALTFAWCHEVAMTPVNLRLIQEYLAYQRRLRALLAGAALVLPGLVASDVGGSSSDVPTVSWWPLWAVIAATVWAEVAFARPFPAAGAPRAAQLAPRRVVDYLSPRWQRLPVAASAVAVAAWASTLLVPVVDEGSDGPTGLTVTGAVALALAVPLVVFGVGTWLVRRPRPVIDPDMVTADDAVRAASLRTLATVGTTILAVDLAAGLVPWAGPARGAGDALVAVAVVASVVAALLSWSSRDVWSRPAARRSGPGPSPRPPVAP